MNQNVVEWVETNFASPKTRRLYRTAVEDFLSFAGEVNTPMELERKVKRWLQQLNSDKAPKSIRAYLSAVKSYFADHGITLPQEKWRSIIRRLTPPAKPLTMDKAGTHEEWKRILTVMPLAGRSLFLFLLSSGCRIEEALQLKVDDLELEADPPRAYMRQPYTKGGFGGRIVFMTYEARDAILQWLEVKQKIRKREPRIYRGLVAAGILPTPKRGNQKRDLHRVWDFNDRTVREILYNALEKAGLDERDPITNRYRLHVHSTRKFFRSYCGLEEGLVHALMAHSGYLDSAYFRKLQENPDEVGQEYKAIAMPRLTIFERTAVDKVEMIKAFARSLGIENIDIKIARMLEENPELDEEQAIGKLIRQELAITPRRERKVIDESELERYINEGWEIEHVVNSKIVVVR